MVNGKVAEPCCCGTVDATAGTGNKHSLSIRNGKGDSGTVTAIKAANSDCTPITDNEIGGDVSESATP